MKVNDYSVEKDLIESRKKAIKKIFTKTNVDNDSAGIEYTLRSLA